MAFLMRAARGGDPEAKCALRTLRALTRPEEKTKEPTPRSISEVPQFSTLAKRRGKMRKSTARMATQVMTIMAPR